MPLSDQAAVEAPEQLPDPRDEQIAAALELLQDALQQAIAHLEEALQHQNAIREAAAKVQECYDLDGDPVTFHRLVRALLAVIAGSESAAESEEEDYRGGPVSQASVRVFNSIIHAKIPEENIQRIEVEHDAAPTSHGTAEPEAKG